MAENFGFQTLEFWGWRSRIDVGWGGVETGHILTGKGFFLSPTPSYPLLFVGGKVGLLQWRRRKKSFFPRLQEGGIEWEGGIHFRLLDVLSCFCGFNPLLREIESRGP